MPLLPSRLHVTGASGTGTTTLGRTIAERGGHVHLDADDYYWAPTDPPFTIKRPASDRAALLARDIAALDRWVISGSLCGWGDRFVPRFETVVFLVVPTPVRLARLRRRERAEFGDAALAPGGVMYDNHEDFIAWAADYDDGPDTMRSRRTHEAWLARLPCPVIRLEGEMDVDTLVEAIAEAAGPG